MVSIYRSLQEYPKSISQLIEGNYAKNSGDALNLMKWTIHLVTSQLNLSPGPVIVEFIYGAIEITG